MVPRCDRDWERTQDAALANALQSAGSVVSGVGPRDPVYPGRPGTIPEPLEAKLFHPLEALSCTQAPPCTQRSSATCGAPYDVLVAEDHPINLKLVLVLLQAAGCRFTCAGNGVQALTELEKADFDLIVMDSQMPVMTGIEAIENHTQAGRLEAAHSNTVADCPRDEGRRRISHRSRRRPLYV